MSRALRPVPVSPHGMVCAGNPLAAAAGVRMLERGGNAFDAALAASAVLAVTIPHMNGLGGDAFGLLFEAATAAAVAVNGSGCAPGRATVETYRALGFSSVPTRGPFAISTPGLVDAWRTLAERGRFRLAETLAPAIALAADGFPVPRELADYAASGEYGRLAEIEAGLVGLNGLPEELARRGGRLRMPALAQSLSRIAAGGLREFYEGETAGLLVRDLARRDALLGAKDLSGQRTLIQRPLSSRTEHGDLLTCPPNTQGFLLNLIVEAMLSSGVSFGEPAFLPRFLAVKERAFARRDRTIGDPELAPDAEALLAPLAMAEEYAPSPVARAGTADTTCLVAADRDGNAVSWVQSLFDDFGSGVVSASTGIVLQNRLSLATLDDDAPRALRPFFRPPHTLCPALVLRDGRLRYALATPGGHGQPQTLAQIVLALHDDPGADLQAVVEAPRICQEYASEVLVESRLSSERIEAIRRAGYRIRDSGPFGRAAGTANALGAALVIARDDDGSLRGAADPRRDGYAIPVFTIGENE